MQRTNEDHLIDFWCIESRYSTEIVFVDEATARAVVKAQAVNTPLDGAYITPVMHELRDLHGETWFIRLDAIINIRSSSPEGRASDKRQAELIDPDGDE